jgi:hypothetical protein
MNQARLLLSSKESKIFEGNWGRIIHLRIGNICQEGISS